MSRLEKAENFSVKFLKVMGVLAVVAIVCVLLFGKKTKNADGTPITEHNLYKDMTYDEWKGLVEEDMTAYIKCTDGMDNSNPDLHGMCIQSAVNRRIDFNSNLDSRANLTSEQRSELKKYYDQRWSETTAQVNSRIEQTDRNNYPNKYR